MSQAATTPAIAPVLRRRLTALTYLGVATAIAIVLALVAIWLRASSVEPAFRHQVLFPNLAAKAKDVATILVETKAAAFSVTRNADGRWVLPGKSGYPAEIDVVRKTIVALSELEAIDQRTARPDWHERLGLGLPKSGGTGTVVTLKNTQGAVLASLVSGQAVEGVAASGNTAMYVRRPDENQTFVALGSYAPQADQAQWLDKTFLDLARDRVKTIEMKPLKGPSYTVTRAKPEDQNFVVGEPLPRGRVLRTEAEPNGVGNALVGATFEDVARAETLDFANAAHARYVTFDGLTLNVSAIEKDRDFWIVVKATANPQPVAPAPTAPVPSAPATSPLKPDVTKEASEINRMAAGWAYKVPRFKGVLITAALEDLLKPIGGPATPPAAPSPPVH